MAFRVLKSVFKAPLSRSHYVLPVTLGADWIQEWEILNENRFLRRCRNLAALAKTCRTPETIEETWWPYANYVEARGLDLFQLVTDYTPDPVQLPTPG